jgi:3-dehydroquinate synthase class II
VSATVVGSVATDVASVSSSVMAVVASDDLLGRELAISVASNVRPPVVLVRALVGDVSVKPSVLLVASVVTLVRVDGEPLDERSLRPADAVLNFDSDFLDLINSSVQRKHSNT